MISAFTKYYSGDQNQNSGMGYACSTYAKEERCTQLFGRGKFDGKSSLGRTKRRWDNNIKCIMQKWDGAACTGLI